MIIWLEWLVTEKFALAILVMPVVDSLPFTRSKTSATCQSQKDVGASQSLEKVCWDPGVVGWFRGLGYWG